MIDECLVVEFSVTGDDCPLAEATRETGATIDARPPQLRHDDYALLRFSAGAEADELADALDADERIRYLHVSRTDSRTNFRCLSKHPCVVHELTDAGFMAETLQYREGTERYTGAVVGHDVLQGVLSAAAETVGVSLERVFPLGSEDDEAVAQRWDVTPAQEVALRTAMEMGYFSVPRGATAAAVADELGISKSAFLERLRRGQATLFAQVFG
ncbi:helix-turn-helix domain-containing protein [Halorussus gelatinilyticus]|uniref:Helix-turn-helix domain-containing protein n=1 Tax=Halorussus gelatinilyticus TaxID=2937524 RepID=A0A8U0IH19_9EURY|nr:helix-turn-helix domain-containing protein [Halorussus gelatinilyticus]UPW00273.1 helix-turn-helix domain-containing protein [Halorussus gelatinilyticus]